jgi:hypothetical protein
MTDSEHAFSHPTMAQPSGSRRSDHGLAGGAGAPVHRDCIHCLPACASALFWLESHLIACIGHVAGAASLCSMPNVLLWHHGCNRLTTMTFAEQADDVDPDDWQNNPLKLPARQRQPTCCGAGCRSARAGRFPLSSKTSSTRDYTDYFAMKTYFSIPASGRQHGHSWPVGATKRDTGFSRRGTRHRCLPSAERIRGGVQKLRSERCHAHNRPGLSRAHCLQSRAFGADPPRRRPGDRCRDLGTLTCEIRPRCRKQCLWRTISDCWIPISSAPAAPSWNRAERYSTSSAIQ